MLASRVNDLKDLRERAAEMRASSKELKDNNTATVILRLAELKRRDALARSDLGYWPISSTACRSTARSLTIVCNCCSSSGGTLRRPMSVAIGPQLLFGPSIAEYRSLPALSRGLAVTP